MKEDVQNLYAMQQAYTWLSPEAYPEAYPNGLHQAEQQQQQLMGSRNDTSMLPFHVKPVCPCYRMFLNDPSHHDITVIYHSKGIPYSKGCPEYSITTKEWKELGFPLYKTIQVDRASWYWYIEKLKKDGKPVPPDLLEKDMHDLEDMHKEGILPPQMDK